MYNQDQGIYLVNSENLMRVENWRHNRPVDTCRVQEIIKNIEYTGIVDGILYICEMMTNTGCKYYCYDGNHRLQAIKESTKSYLVLINIYKVDNDDQIKEKFFKLNMANPVPELYFDTATKTLVLKNIVDEVVKHLINKYPKNLTTSPHPRKPNFNRDNATDNLYKYLTDLNKPNITTEYLINELDRINEDCKNNTIKFKNASTTCLNKAAETNCYLFLIDYCQEIKI